MSNGYFVIAVVLFSVGVYGLGRARAEGRLVEFNPLETTVALLLLSISWLPSLALALVIIPFFLLYRMGKRQGKIAMEKKKMWETLSK